MLKFSFRGLTYFDYSGRRIHTHYVRSRIVAYIDVHAVRFPTTALLTIAYNINPSNTKHRPLYLKDPVRTAQ